jgi:hypothetical protein
MMTFSLASFASHRHVHVESSLGALFVTERAHTVLVQTRSALAEIEAPVQAAAMATKIKA